MAGSRTILGLMLMGLCLLLPAYGQNKPKKTLSGLNLQGFAAKTDTKKEWSKSPFLEPINEVPLSELKLTGIVYSKEDALALVNDQIVRKGDTIGASRVVDIQKTQVLLTNEDGIFSLKLEASQ